MAISSKNIIVSLAIPLVRNVQEMERTNAPTAIVVSSSNKETTSASMKTLAELLKAITQQERNATNVISPARPVTDLPRTIAQPAQKEGKW